MQLLEAAAGKDPWAKITLANLLLAGIDLPKDAARAIQLLEEAAAAGNSSALASLGAIYLTGNGVAADPAKAQDYLEKAIAAGDTSAQRRLGEALIKGQGIAKDTARGVQLLEAAAERDPRAKFTLGKFFLQGEDLKRDIGAATRLFNSAAEAGVPNGLEELGRSYLFGTFTPSNSKRAAAYLTRAGRMGLGSAWAWLAKGVASGKIPDSKSSFEQYARRARALGDPSIEVYDAERYFWGQGVEKNLSKSLALLEKASARGNTSAIRYLIGIYRDGRKPQVMRSRARASQYLEKFGAGLPPAQRQQEAILIRVASAADPGTFLALVEDAEVFSVVNQPEFQSQLMHVNPNFSVFRAQKGLKKAGLYSGPLNGLATEQTLRAIRAGCQQLKNSYDCGPFPLTARNLYRLAISW